MPTLTIKNIPDELYSRLKESARVHCRSLNSEIIYCVERMLVPYKIDISGHLAMASKLRAKTATNKLTDEDLAVAINIGRP